MSQLNRSPLAILVVTLAFSVVSLPAMAQDGLLMRDIFGKIGLLPEDKEPIEFKERPALVVPKDTSKLRQPEQPGAHADNSQWPVDPDVEERKREQERKGQVVRTPLKADASEGGRLSLSEMAKGRVAPGTVLGEGAIPRNDQAGVRISPAEWSKQSRQASGSSTPPGVEPERRYLTDPPRGLRQAAANAPFVRTQDEPRLLNDDRRPEKME